MAIRRPKVHRLERVLGTGTLFSAAYGNVGSTVYYALGLVAALALGLTPVAYLISGAIFVFTAATYSEATVMYPEAGGSSSFARHAFNELASFFAAWGQMFNYVITVSISAYFVPNYLAVFWAPLKTMPYNVIGGIIVIALLCLLNIVGTKESAGVNLVLAIIDLVSQGLVVVLGIVMVLSPEILIENVHLGIAPTWSNLVLGVAVAMIAYTGIETLSNMGEETRDVTKSVPAAYRATVVVVLVMFLLLALVALSAMPVHEVGGVYETELGTKYQGDPVLGIVENLPLGVFQRSVEVFVGILAAVILVMATNAGLLGVSRLTYSMGQYRQLPGAVRRIHHRFRTPYVAILLFGAIAAVTMLPGQAELLAKLYAFGAMLSFTIAHISLIRLRYRYPDHPRLWRSPVNLRIGGGDLPILAVLGGAGTLFAWLIVMARDLKTTIVGFAWLAIGTVVYVSYRRYQRLPMAGTVKLKEIGPVVEREVEYRSVLVAVEDLNYRPEAVVTAAKLAARRRRGIHVLIMIEVPLHLPISASLPAQERKGAGILESARLAGGRRVSGEVVKIRHGAAGRAIVRRARDIQAEAIVMPLIHRRVGSDFGKTLQAVLEERPCRVIVTCEPARSRMPSTRHLPA